MLASLVTSNKGVDKGMTNRPPIFAYLGPGGITIIGIARPIKIAA
jgi:hypothetical protein